MALEIGHREVDGIEILDLKGGLNLGQEDLRFRAALARLIKRGKTRVLLNICLLHSLDSAGVGTVLSTMDDLRKAGGNLALFSGGPRGSEMPNLALIETTVQVFADEQNAINSFFPGRTLKPFDILEFATSGDSSAGIPQESSIGPQAQQPRE